MIVADTYTSSDRAENPLESVPENALDARRRFLRMREYTTADSFKKNKPGSLANRVTLRKQSITIMITANQSSHARNKTHGSQTMALGTQTNT